MLASKIEQRTCTDFRILVVNESNAHLQLLETWLSESGFKVVAANGGYKAILRFNNEHFDLVLTDICMSEINGNILAQYIHAIRRDIPVFAVTDSPMLADHDFDLVLSKPCELAGLVTSLQYAWRKLPSNVLDLNDSKRKLLHQLQELEHGY